MFIVLLLHTIEEQSSVNAELLLKTIYRELKLPIVGLFDSNIKGFEMLSITAGVKTVTVGSI